MEIKLIMQRTGLECVDEPKQGMGDGRVAIVVLLTGEGDLGLYKIPVVTSLALSAIN